MKVIVFVLLTGFISLTAFGQDITGQWNGILKIQGTQLRVGLNISRTATGYSSTMDSPDQGEKGIPVTSTSFGNSTLKFTVSNAGIEYEGILGPNNVVAGNFKQGGQSFLLNLSREKVEKEKLLRPQEPTKPYPYYSEDITFQNKKANIALAGTLTLPQKEGNYPVVILITGSGAQNRDEEVMSHKPFLIISDYLTRNGIAVLRYDDRGSAQSTGDFKIATTVDFASDVESAISYLKTRKEINVNKIGLIGHSEGGIIAPMVASTSRDVKFIVLLAGVGLSGDKLMLLQSEKIAQEMHIDAKEISKTQEIFRGAYQIILRSNASDPNLKNKISTYFKQRFGSGASEEQVDGITNQLVNPWSIYFIKYNPVPALEKVKCPVLAINGEKDLQVPPKENLEVIGKALTKGGNKDFTIKVLPGLNHLFQECKTGLPGEYASIEQTFSPTALTEILKWIQIQTN